MRRESPDCTIRTAQVRPGDILRSKTHVFSAMDQWASRAGAAVPLSEWRGRIELEQFLAGPPGVRVAAGSGGGGKGGKAEAGATTGVTGMGGVESSGSSRMDNDNTSGSSERREGPVTASFDVSSWGIVSRPQVSILHICMSSLGSTTPLSGLEVLLGYKNACICPIALGASHCTFGRITTSSMSPSHTRLQVGQGDLVWSTVKSVKPYGVFVSLSKQQDALMPVSQVSRGGRLCL